jgi:hypothetical protein
VDTTEDFSIRFDPVPDDPAVAMRTYGRQRVNRALEAIKGVTLAAHNDLKRFIVFVLTNFAFSHTQLLRAAGGARRCFIWSDEPVFRSRPTGITDAGYSWAAES